MASWGQDNVKGEGEVWYGEAAGQPSWEQETGKGKAACNSNKAEVIIPLLYPFLPFTFFACRTDQSACIEGVHIRNIPSLSRRSFQYDILLDSDGE